MRIISRQLLLIATVLLAACETVQPPLAPEFSAKPAPAGQARMYLFRPLLDRVNVGDQPSVLLNDRAVAAMGHGTYLELSLLPGQHRIRLSPGPRDSPDWSGEFAFEVKPDQTLFVAVWNQNQPGRSKIVPVPIPGWIIFVPIPGSVNGKQAVTLEPVDVAIARTALAGLKALPAPSDPIAAR